MEFIFTCSHSISMWTLEDKFHIAARPCIFLYVCLTRFFIDFKVFSVAWKYNLYDTYAWIYEHRVKFGAKLSRLSTGDTFAVLEKPEGYPSRRVEEGSPGARFSKAPETFRARKAIFRSSVSKNGKVYTPETSCMKGPSLHLNNIWIKQRCNRKVRDFAMALRARNVSGAFEKRAPGTWLPAGNVWGR